MLYFPYLVINMPLILITPNLKYHNTGISNDTSSVSGQIIRFIGNLLGKVVTWTIEV